MTERPSHRLTFDGRPWVGANFWSSAGGPFMWRSYDRDIVSRELATMKSLGMTAIRSFCLWPDFHPEPYTFDRVMIDRYRDFLDLHEQHGLLAVPTFIIGMMSGGVYEPSWRNGENLYTSGWMLSRQAEYIQTVVTAIADHPAIAGWLISNEMLYYGGPDDHENVRAWAQLMVQAVRAGGGKGPVSLGDGAIGTELYGEETGFRLRELAPLQDWVGPHLYGMSDDVVRSHLLPAFKVELAGAFDRPVVLEEFGLTTNFSSDKHAGQYYGQVLHSSLAAGASGFVAWNNTDFDLPLQSPYSHHPFEQHFGITRADGTLKAPAHEMKRFSEELAEVELGRTKRTDTECVMIVPRWIDGGPGDEPGAAAEYLDILQQSYISARQAGLTPALAREESGIPDARLVLVPCGRRLDSASWIRLEEIASAGATVYVSYFSGSSPAQRGPWHPNFDAMFGVENQLRYGLVEPIDADEIRLELNRSVGSGRSGDSLVFRVAGSYSARSQLPYGLVDASEIATSEAGPALLERRVGAGRLLLLTCPVEYFAAKTPGVNPDPASVLYRWLAEEADALPAIDNGGDPRLLVDTLTRDDGAVFAIVVSEHDIAVTRRIGGVDVDLPPWGTAILHIN
jgi:endo-1,4-beta-mannosidase